MIQRSMATHFHQIAVQKQSANVVEKSIESLGEKITKEYVKSLQREGVIKSILKNSDSFYVVQKISVNISDVEDVRIVHDLIAKNACYVNEKKLKVKVANLLKELHDYIEEND